MATSLMANRNTSVVIPATLLALRGEQAFLRFRFRNGIERGNTPVTLPWSYRFEFFNSHCSAYCLDFFEEVDLLTARHERDHRLLVR